MAKLEQMEKFKKQSANLEELLQLLGRVNSLRNFKNHSEQPSNSMLNGRSDKNF